MAAVKDEVKSEEVEDDTIRRTCVPQFLRTLSTNYRNLHFSSGAKENF